MTERKSGRPEELRRQLAFGAGDAALQARLQARGVTQSAPERLEKRLRLVVVVHAGVNTGMEGELPLAGERPEQVTHHVDGQLAHALPGPAPVHHGGAPTPP